MKQVAIAGSLGIDRAELVALCEAKRSSVLASLPFTAAEIANATSMHALVTLVDRYGGSICYIPKQASSKSVLATLIGLGNLVRLVSSFGPGNLQIPSKYAVVEALRPLIARKLRETGLSLGAIARRLGVHHKTVKRALTRKPA